MKEAISSIHIEAGNISVVKHNDRSFATVNAIFNDEVNEYDFSGAQAIKRFRNFLKPRIEAHSKRTGQKLNKKTITHLSVIVNTKKATTMIELRLLANYLEDILGTQVFQIAIHRDEGHIKDGKNIKNYHAHIEMLGIDQNGYSIRRKLTRKVLSNLQDKTAEILKMQRGVNYAKEKKKRPRRLGTYEYKEYKKREEIAIATIKKELTAKLDAVTAKLEATNQLKLRAENVFIELISQLQLNIERRRTYKYEEIKSMILDKFNQLKGVITPLRDDNNTFKLQMEKARKVFVDLKQNNSKLRVTLDNTRDQLKSSLTEVSELAHKVEFLEAQIKSNNNSNTYKNEADEDEDNDFKFNL